MEKIAEPVEEGYCIHGTLTEVGSCECELGWYDMPGLKFKCAT